MTRDPRTDPQPGDIVSSGDFIYVVTKREGDQVYFDQAEVYGDDDVESLHVSMFTDPTDDVLHVADVKSMIRDPRIDPQPGDVLKDRDSPCVYVVISRSGDDVEFYEVFVGAGPNRHHRCIYPLIDFTDPTDIVLHVAEAQS